MLNSAKSQEFSPCNLLNGQIPKKKPWRFFSLMYKFYLLISVFIFHSSVSRFTNTRYAAHTLASTKRKYWFWQYKYWFWRPSFGFIFLYYEHTLQMIQTEANDPKGRKIEFIVHKWKKSFTNWFFTKWINKLFLRELS